MQTSHLNHIPEPISSVENECHLSIRWLLRVCMYVRMEVMFSNRFLPINKRAIIMTLLTASYCKRGNTHQQRGETLFYVKKIHHWCQSGERFHLNANVCRHYSHLCYVVATFLRRNHPTAEYRLEVDAAYV